jgi:hypothetical protein
LSLVTCSVSAKDASLDMPSSVPIDVFEMNENQIGIGYIQTDVQLSLHDDYYGDKIGDVSYKTKGLIVSLPKKMETPIGKMFELSFTAGSINSVLDDKQFTDGGFTYNNTYDKTGFYVGVRPAFSKGLYDTDMFKAQVATSLHTMFYHLSGDFSVNRTGNSYAYDESSYGIGLKPTVVLSGTFMPTSHFGISAFGGASTFLALDYNNYSGKNTSTGSDTELVGYTSSVDPVYGADLVYRGIFSKDDKINLSSILGSKQSNTSIETIVRYVFNF